MQFKQPVYSLKIDSLFCGYHITVNGCPVERHKNMAPLTIEYPINHWLKNGDNTIDVYFLNIPDPLSPGDKPNTFVRMLAPRAQLTCTLLVKEAGQSQKYPLSSIVFDGKKTPRIDEIYIDYDNLDQLKSSLKGSTHPGNYQIEKEGLIEDENGDFSVGEIEFGKGVQKCLYLSQPVKLHAPFPTWKFFSGESHPRHTTLNDDEWDEAREEMLVEYKKIWNIVNSGKLDELRPILSDRCSEYDQSFYQPIGQNLDEFIEELRLDLADPDWPLKEISLKSVDYSVSFSGQLVWLHGFGNPMGGPLKLKHTESDLAKKYIFYYAKIDGEWKVVR